MTKRGESFPPVYALEARPAANGRDTYGAFKVGWHDDMVTALGLATQPLARWTAA